MRYIIKRASLRGLGADNEVVSEETTTPEVTDLVLTKDTKFGWVTLIVAALATGIVGYFVGKR